MTEWQKEIRAAISQLLDKTPDEIATFLDEKGIDGIPCDADSCPIAHWMRKQLDPHEERREDDITAGPTALMWQSIWIPTPENIRVFMENFDSGLYPNLEKAET